MSKSIYIRLSVGLMLAAIVPLGAANAVTVSRDFSGNDCSGFFGSPFPACTIFVNDNGVDIELSPVIAKYDWDDDGSGSNHVITQIEVNDTVFPSVDGSEYSFSNVTTGDEAKTGDWDYTPAGADPGTRYWAVKAGNQFRLYWDVDAGAVAAGGACDVADLYVLGCLDAANLVSSGDWDTAGGLTAGKGLSHITFYDTAIPVPAAVWLFGSALGLLGWMRRKAS